MKDELMSFLDIYYNDWILAVLFLNNCTESCAVVERWNFVK